LIVYIVQEHGPVAIEELRAELERLWAAEDTAWVWSPEARRNVVMALYDAGASDEWTRAQLESIASTMLDGKDISGKVDECEAHAKAWCTLGDDEEAVEELKRLVSVSFGVGYRKDYQMDQWVEWLDRVVALDPDKVGERISLFAAAIAATEETTEGRGTRSAALALIESCVPVSPRRAVALIHWFEKYEAGPLLLPVDRGGIIRFRRLTDQAIYEILKRLAARAGVEHITARDLRRTLVVALIASGLDLQAVQKRVGHASWMTTAMYQSIVKRRDLPRSAPLEVPYVPPKQRRVKRDGT